MVHVVVARPWASEPGRSRELRAVATTFVRSVLARLAAPRLDARLAAGEDPVADAVLARRSRRLVAGRSRRRLACGLERAWSMPPRHTVLSAAVAVDQHAVGVARPAYREELYEIARAALFALGSSDVASTEPLRR